MYHLEAHVMYIQGRKVALQHSLSLSLFLFPTMIQERTCLETAFPALDCLVYRMRHDLDL